MKILDEKTFLGGLCNKNHTYQDTNKSLRYKSDRTCVVCRQTQSKNWSNLNPEKHKDLKDSWHKTHKDHHNKWKKDYRNNNIEARRSYERNYTAANKFKCVCKSAKARSLKRKLNFDLTEQFLQELW